MSRPWAMFLIFPFLSTDTAFAQPPVRMFDDPGSPPFKVLKTGENPPLDVDGNFVIGPEYTTASERKVVEGVPQGKVKQFTIDSKETKLFNPGIARKVFGKVDPKNSKTLIVETHTIDYKRQITIYVPAQHVAGSEAPFMVIHDGPTGKPNMELPRILDNLIAQKRIPPIIAIMVANGGGDAQGHERGKEYDTMSEMYADYIETEVLPRVEKHCEVKLTRDPDGRAAMGNSSGGSAALIMAWYRTNLYHRVLTTSGTFVNQQWPFNPETPGGAWDFHETIIPNNPKKPLRIFISVGDRDLLNPNVMRDGMHDWVEANNRMAKVLKAKGYHYQYLFCRDSGHSIGNAQAQFLPHAIEWLWQGYFILSGSTRAQDSKPAKIRVLLLGDSTVIGSVCRMVHPKADHLEDVIRKLLAAEGDLPPVEVVNRGQDGDTLHRLLGGRYQNDVAKQGKWDFIFIRYGLNDLGNLKDFAKEYPANYKKLIARLRTDHPGAEIVLETVIPYLGDKNDKTINDQVRAVALAEKLPVLDQHTPYAAELKNGQNMLNYRRLPLKGVPKKFQSLIPPESIKGGTVFIMDNLLDSHLGKVPGWFSDRHPNLAGYHVIGTQIAGYLRSRLREKMSTGVTNKKER